MKLPTGEIIPASSFLRNDIPAVLYAKFSALSNDGVDFGVTAQASLNINSPTTEFRVISNQSGNDIKFYTKVGATSTLVMTMSGSNGLVTVKSDPSAALGVATKQYVDTANVNLKNYTDTKIVANAVTMVGNITTANTAMKTYVDAANVRMTSFVNASNSSLKAYTDNTITTSNSSMKTYSDATLVASNSSMKTYVDANIISSNSSMKTYVDAANVKMKSYVDAGVAGTVTQVYVDNLVTTTNSSMKTYVDAKVTTANTAMKAYVDTSNSSMKGYVDGQVSTISTAALNALAKDGTNTITGNITPTSNAATISLGSSSNWFANIWSTTFRGKSITAAYADLAEMYVTDQEYEIGTVLVAGGEEELTQCNINQIPVGVISAAPAFLMNDKAPGQAVALKGRVPVKVLGPVRKGEGLTSGYNGVAITSYDAANCPDTLPSSVYLQRVFAVSLENNNDPEVKLVECIIL